MNSKKALHTVPVPSTEFVEEAFWDGRGPRPTIRFAYVQRGVQVQGGIEFRNVSAMRKRAERCCTAWHLEGAYDTLLEIIDSTWLSEILADTSAHWRSKWEMHHFMIYLDSVGCFEIIAESWAATQQS